jgi:hypothetical protein
LITPGVADLGLDDGAGSGNRLEDVGASVALSRLSVGVDEALSVRGVVHGEPTAGEGST